MTLASPHIDRWSLPNSTWQVYELRDLGFSRPIADRRAYTAYAAYLGMIQLEADDDHHPSVSSAGPYVDELITMFVSGAPTSEQSNPDRSIE